MESSLEAAKFVQESLLTVPTKMDNWLYSDFYKASEKAGGDWYSILHDEAQKTLFAVIGDVAGHGIPAALITGAANSVTNYIFSQSREQKWSKEKTAREIITGIDIGIKSCSKTYF